MIREDCPDHDPTEVEAYMRLEFGTLDHLPRDQFRREARLAARCVDADPRQAKALVASYGL